MNVLSSKEKKARNIELKSREKNFYDRQQRIEFEMHQFWKPHKGQAPLAYALFRKYQRYIFMQCGRKLGKTDFSLYCMYLFAMLFPNSQIYYIADTMKHGGELVWENGRLPRFFLSPKRLPFESQENYERRRKIGKELHTKWVVKKNESEMRITFSNGSFIKVDGAENYANADGIEPDFIVYDEFKHHDPRFHIAMDPNLRVKKAPLMILGTPPEEHGTYYEKIAKSVQRMSYGYFCRRPSYLNPILYPLGEKDPEFQEEVKKYIDREEEDVLRRELYAEIVISGSKAIFPVLELPEYDWDNSKYIGYSKHVRPHKDMMAEIRHKPKDWEYYAVFDPGSTVCFGVLFMAFNRIDKRVFILDEIYEKDQRETTTRKIVTRAIEKWRNIHPYDGHWEKQYDYAAAWFENEAWELFPDYSFSPCEKDIGSKGEDKKEAKLSMIKDMLIHGKLAIASETCPNTVWEMSSYRKDEKGKIPKENDHLIDCLRYGLNAMNYDPMYAAEDSKFLDTPRRAYKMGEDKEDTENYLSSSYYSGLKTNSVEKMSSVLGYSTEEEEE